MTLRSKLLLGQAPLAIVLVLLAALGAGTVTSLGRSPELLLAENYRSVLAAERMLAALERIEADALFRAAGRPGDEAGTAGQRARFQAELEAQEGNITEPGEEAATRRLRASWTAYLGEVAAQRGVAEPGGPGGPSGPSGPGLEAHFDRLVPAYRAVQDAAGHVLAVNQDAMQAKSERVRARAERSVNLVIAVTAAALLAGLLASLALTARLLRPLGVLARTARRLGEGDLAARAALRGGDEIAALAREFDTMADRLAQYRQSSLGELLQAQQAAQAAIDSLPDPVLVIDAAGVISNANGAAEKLLEAAGPGAPPSLSALPPALREAVERVRAHVLAGRGPWSPRGFEDAVRLDGPEGARHLLPRASPLYSEKGVVGVTLVLQDVTRLMRFDELKNDLVATVAHEFRTPLTSLRMAVHLCAEEVVGPLTVKQADLMQAAREDLDRLQGIVDDLLDLSRIQSGRMELRLAPVEVAALLAEAEGALRGAAEAAGVELLARVAEPGLAVAADRERAAIVLANLVSNGIRHTSAGGRVTAEAARLGERVRFEVADTGEGIAPEHQARIFEKFYRVPGARGGSVGLGLWISREIVEAHGGEMGVSSAPGQGSRFWFTLPAAAPAEAAA